MKMKRYKRRKTACILMRKMAAVIMWIGILGALGTAGRIGLGMSPVQGVKQLLAEAAIMTLAWIIHSMSIYMARHIITFSDTKEKKRKK